MWKLQAEMRILEEDRAAEGWRRAIATCRRLRRTMTGAWYKRRIQGATESVEINRMEIYDEHGEFQGCTSQPRVVLLAAAQWHSALVNQAGENLPAAAQHLCFRRWYGRRANPVPPEAWEGLREVDDWALPTRHFEAVRASIVEGKKFDSSNVGVEHVAANDDVWELVGAVVRVREWCIVAWTFCSMSS